MVRLLESTGRYNALGAHECQNCCRDNHIIGRWIDILRWECVNLCFRRIYIKRRRKFSLQKKPFADDFQITSRWALPKLSCGDGNPTDLYPPAQQMSITCASGSMLDAVRHRRRHHGQIGVRRRVAWPSIWPAILSSSTVADGVLAEDKPTTASRTEPTTQRHRLSICSFSSSLDDRPRMDGCTIAGTMTETRWNCEMDVSRSEGWSSKTPSLLVVDDLALIRFRRD